MSDRVPLDNYRTVQPHARVPCDECGETRSCLCFWELGENSLDPGLGPTYSVCPYCFSRAEGRFKNESLGQLLRGLEQVTSWSLHDDYLLIGTRSPLGYFFHVHYTNMEYEPVDTTVHRLTGEPVVRYVPTPVIAGPAEVFDEEGVGLGVPSPYGDLAAQILRSEYR